VGDARLDEARVRVREEDDELRVRGGRGWVDGEAFECRWHGGRRKSKAGRDGSHCSRGGDSGGGGDADSQVSRPAHWPEALLTQSVFFNTDSRHNRSRGRHAKLHEDEALEELSTRRGNENDLTSLCICASDEGKTAVSARSARRMERSWVLLVGGGIRVCPLKGLVAGRFGNEVTKTVVIKLRGFVVSQGVHQRKEEAHVWL